MSIPTSTGSSRSSDNNSKSSGDGISREGILTIIFGVLGAVVAISIGIWQGKKDSYLRKRLARKPEENNIEMARRRRVSNNGDNV